MSVAMEMSARACPAKQLEGQFSFMVWFINDVDVDHARSARSPARHPSNLSSPNPPSTRPYPSRFPLSHWTVSSPTLGTQTQTWV